MMDASSALTSEAYATALDTIRRQIVERHDDAVRDALHDWAMYLGRHADRREVIHIAELVARFGGGAVVNRLFIDAIARGWGEESDYLCDDARETGCRALASHVALSLDAVEDSLVREQEEAAALGRRL
jgi:hypothetical protein